MNKAEIIKDLKSDEGFVPHAYQDSLGYWTIGYGRLIDKRLGGGITEDEADTLLARDAQRCINEVIKAFPWVVDHPEAIQQALVNMAFQMGLKKLQGFSTTLKHIKARNYGAAADSAMQSLWARQTPSRAKRVTNQIRSAGSL